MLAADCVTRDIDCWEGFVGGDHERQFCGDGRDRLAHRITAVQPAFDEPLEP